MGLIIASMLGMVGTKMTNYQKEVMGRLDAANQVVQEETPTDKEIVDNEESKEESANEPEIVQIVIKEGLSSEEIAEMLYRKQLIASKEDFKILLNLRTLDTVKAGQVLTDHGIISQGWKVTQLLGVVSRKHHVTSQKIYEAKLIDDEASLTYILGALKEKENVVPGKKSIKRGTSMNEIVEILIQ
jgi:cell division protein YceG involved in septum cleavage